MNKQILTITYLTLLEVRRNRLLWLLGFVLVIGFGLSQVVGDVAVTESVAMKNGLLGAFLRISAIFITALFVVTSTVREFNDKVLDLVLSMPMPRAWYYFGKLTGFSVFAGLIALVFSLPLFLQADGFQVVLWGVSLFAELLIIVAVSLLCLFTLNQVTVALSVVCAFYFLSRTIGAIQLMTEGSMVSLSSFGSQVLSGSVDTLAFILPDLYLFTRSEWLIYQSGDWQTLLPLIGQTAVYLVFLSGASLFDLYRKSL